MSKLPVGCFWLASWVFTSELKHLVLSILFGSLQARSRVEGSAQARVSPSGVYLAGRLQQLVKYLWFRFYWFCSPEGVINSSCWNYGFFLFWGQPFQGCGEAYGLCTKQRTQRARLAFPGLSCGEASVTLYLWFQSQPFVAGFVVLNGLKNFLKSF